jgi:SAM-dependent methyltransferase
MTNTWLSHELIADTATEIIAGRTSLGADPAALPFAQNSLDLLTLPHTLELSGDPHMTLSEAHRVLIPEGRVVICGLNPQSLWGFRQHFVPETQEWISLRRLRDWLRLLSFEVESVRFGCYRPALDSGAGLAHSRCLDAIGPKWWPIFGAAYFVVAVKRVRGVTRLTRAKWTRPSLNVAPLPVANNAIK